MIAPGSPGTSRSPPARSLATSRAEGRAREFVVRLVRRARPGRLAEGQDRGGLARKREGKQGNVIETTVQLREHQVAALDALARAVAAGRRRNIVVLPTGTGKTITGL